MLKCLNCSHVFDESEAATEREPHYELDGAFCEYFSVCPNCHSEDISDAYQCAGCGEWFFGDEVIGGHYCKTCLYESITYDNFYEFAVAEGNYDEPDYMSEFVWTCPEIWDNEAKELPRHCSPSFKECIREIYKDHAKYDRPMQNGTRVFLDRIRDYIWRADLEDEFADWLYKKN